MEKVIAIGLPVAVLAIFTGYLAFEIWTRIKKDDGV